MTRSDNIPIKKIKESIVKPLTYAFNLCVEKYMEPDKLKVATIVPVYQNSRIISDEICMHST